MELEVEIISDDGGLLGLVPDSWPPGCVKIAAVLPDSQAEQHKLCVGDELRSINGHEVEELDHRRMALELAKRPLKLMIHRPKEPPSLVIDVEVDVNAGAMGFQNSGHLDLSSLVPFFPRRLLTLMVYGRVTFFGW